MEPHERLRMVRERVFSTGKDAAAALGVPYATYNSHETGERGFARHAARYAKFFKTSVDFLLTGRQTAITAKNSPLVTAGTEGLAVRGFVRAGIWQEEYAPDGDLKTLPITGIAGVPREQQFALEVRGESINRRAKPGSYAICSEWYGPLQNGDVVVFERRRAGLFQSTIKVVRLRNGEVELLPDSDHPDHQEPIVVSREQLEEGDSIAIIARVLGFYTPI